MSNAPGPVMRVVAEQRKRLVASLMSAAETSPWWRRLSREEQLAHREKVLASVGVFYDLCRDVIKVSEEDGVRNEYAIELIEAIHTSVRQGHPHIPAQPR